MIYRRARARKWYMHSSGRGSICLCVLRPVFRTTSDRILSLFLDLLSPDLTPRPRSTSLAPPDHEELAAAESFNREMAELAELEHQHELRSLLQARITGEVGRCRSISYTSPSKHLV